MKLPQPQPRRRLLLAAPLLALAAIPAARADDEYTTTDLAVSCDTPAAEPLKRAADAYRAASGVRVRIFPTGPNLLLPQLKREIQNDIVLTRPTTLLAAEQADLVKPGGRIGPWRNRLILAESTGSAAAEGTFAVPDATPASEFDGAAVLKAMGIAPSKTFGVLNTAAVVFALRNGNARRGLIFRSDLIAADDLRAVADVPDSAAEPVLYAATLTTLAYRIDPGAFLTFLAGPAGRAAMIAGGLEAA